jgi:hypothetical protein
MKVSGCDPNTAVAVVLAFSVNVQLGLLLPEHGPLDQFANVPVVAEADNVKVVPAAKVALHVVPQAIPEGVLETVPEELPFWTRLTVSVNVLGG